MSYYGQTILVQEFSISELKDSILTAIDKVLKKLMNC